MMIMAHKMKVMPKSFYTSIKKNYYYTVGTAKFTTLKEARKEANKNKKLFL